MKRRTAEDELLDVMEFFMDAKATLIPLQMTPEIELAIWHALGDGQAAPTESSRRKCKAIYDAIVVMGLAQLDHDYKRPK